MFRSNQSKTKQPEIDRNKLRDFIATHYKNREDFYVLLHDLDVPDPGGEIITFRATRLVEIIESRGQRLELLSKLRSDYPTAFTEAGFDRYLPAKDEQVEQALDASLTREANDDNNPSRNSSRPRKILIIALGGAVIFVLVVLAIIVSNIQSEESPAVSIALSCESISQVPLSSYADSSCSPNGASGTIQYCQSEPERLRVGIDLRGLERNGNYVLSVQAREAGQETSNLLQQHCENETSQGEGYCDIPLVPANRQGNIQDVVSISLEPGEYEVKFLLKDADTSDHCVAMINDNPPPIRVVPSFQKGITFVTWERGDFASENSDMALGELRATGANWVAIVVTGYQDTITSTTISYNSSPTAADQDLIHAINQAQDLELNIMLKPHVDLIEESTHWRGEIGSEFSESQRQEWFASYRDFVLHYAALAEDNNVKLLSIGTELVSLSSYNREWRQLIEEIRQVFSGEIVYASNWDEQGQSWWAELDYIGIDAYFPLETSSLEPTVAELENAWNPHVAQLEALYQEYQRPLILTEIGYRSVEQAHISPSQWQQDAPVNLTEQANLYQAALETFCGAEWLAGIYWWNWLIDPNQGGEGNAEYTPHNKPAEAVLTEYYQGGACEGRFTLSPAENLVPFNGDNGCPRDGASGEVIYDLPLDNSFRATIKLNQLKENHTYIFTINCREGTETCSWLKDSCNEFNGQGYCDILVGPTDQTGTFDGSIEIPSLPAGEYETKFFVKDGDSDSCVVLYNDRPATFQIGRQ
jgi:hypothetical protein